ncbi:MAG: formate dehydrogenase family accessory protein FdhD [Verrucomicrobiales bacterium VVV1]|nr:MAG: formate dehydrogenase family accessory protein FdhD [Verrucomicrobiales bacterium VVV1]
MDQSVSVITASGESKLDRVAVEEPLQITIDGHPVAVLMRTPGDDEALVTGFLKTEGIIHSRAEIRKLAAEANHALVFLTDEVEWDVTRLSRNLFSASSCGICGKATIDAVMGEQAVVRDGPMFDRSVLLAAPDLLREKQITFNSTGGLHACGLFSRGGELLASYEDVGRHNAVDKVIGGGLLEELDLTECFLLVSGRVSLEVMQKALAAGIPMVAAVSAPSSLAIEFAQQSNQTLVAFLRPPTFTVFSGSTRLDWG